MIKKIKNLFIFQNVLSFYVIKNFTTQMYPQFQPFLMTIYEHHGHKTPKNQ
jgi:hypothetical protein